MAVTEEARHRMYARLEEVLGHDEATTMMDHLPPVGWADVATKRDLAHLSDELKAHIEVQCSGLRADMVGEVGALRTEMGGLRADMVGEVGALRTEMGGLRADLAGEVGALRGDLAGEVGALRTEMGGLRADLEHRCNTLLLQLLGSFAAMVSLVFVVARVA